MPGEESSGESCVRVEEVMASPPVAAPPDTTVEGVARIMRGYGVGSVVLVEDRRPVGLFTEKELVYVVATLGCEGLRARAGDHAMRVFPVVRRDDCVEDAVRAMREYETRHAVVVDDVGSLVGVVSLRDIAVRLAGLEE